MPELPEMQNYRNLLSEHLKGRSVTNIYINREKSINVPINQFMESVQNQAITSIERRAKQLLFHLSNGKVLLLHLMLGGWMFYGKEEDKPDRTIQIQLVFEEQSLYFIGLRLGYLHLHTKAGVDQELEDLGPEPLDINFSLDYFLKLVKDKRGRIKTTLIDQGFLSGIGNCYSDEICWQAQLLPTRNFNELDNTEKVNLYHAIRFILQQGTQNGGYMDEPLYKGDSKTGGIVSKLKVYDREGENCSRCGKVIKKEEISSRKTFFCTGCQK